MPKHDLEKLLRRYATKTLTEEEHQALLAAALHNQKLFYALTEKQALKEQLDDPHSRRRISDALERSSPSPGQSWLERSLDWFRHPANLALSGSLVSAAVAVIALTHLLLHVGPRPTKPLLMADATGIASSREAHPSKPAKQASSKAKTSSVQSVRELPAEKKIARSAEPGTSAPGRVSQPAVERTQKTSSDTRLPKAEQERAPQADLKSPTPKPAAQPPAPAAPSPPKEAQQGLASAPQLVSPDATPAEPKEELAVPIPTDLLPLLQTQKSAGDPRREQRRARALFFAQAEPARTDRGKAGEEQQERPMVAQAPKAETESTAQRFGLLGKIESPTQARNQPIGLRYSILKQGKEGVETETDPAERIEASATLKLTVEVNAPGFLYVLKRDPARNWTVLYPSTEQKEATAAPDPRVEGRTRLEFPLAGAVTVKDQPVRTEAFILYSRQAQQDLNSIIALITGDPRQGGSRAALIDAFIQRARRNAELQHSLIQKMDSTKKGAPKERAVYVVDPSPDPTSPMFVEITVSQQ